MREIEPTKRFRRDYKRELSGQFGRRLEELLRPVLDLLVADELLPERYRDHALVGEWQNHRDCHIRPDLVLIYRKVGVETLQLVRLGSHSELGL